MDKKAVKLRQELRELQTKARKLADQQKEIGERIQATIDSHQKWLRECEVRSA